MRVEAAPSAWRRQWAAIGSLAGRLCGTIVLIPARLEQRATPWNSAPAEAGRRRACEELGKSTLALDLLILDDFALHRLSAQQSEDLYDLIIERHPRASFALTSNRGVDEWSGLFDNPLLGNSALDRLANAAHQLVIEGPSYRVKLAPKQRTTDDAVMREEVVTAP